MNKTLFIILALFVLVFASCGKDRSNEYYALTEENTWVYNEMKDKYLWGDDIVEPQWKQYFGSTTRFFQTLTSSVRQNDIWSYCLPDSELIDPHERGFYSHIDSYGMDCVVMNDPTGTTSRSLARVLTVLNGSPAQLCGLNRGDFIGLVDGERISSSNASKLLTNGSSHKLECYHLGVRDESFVWADTVQCSLSASRYVEDEAFPVHSCFVNPSTGTRVAYLMCSRLIPRPEENVGGDNTYINRLNEMMTEIKAYEPEEFVLDLRLSNYGTVDMAAMLASYIVPADQLGTTFCTTEWNARYSANNRQYLYEPSQSSRLPITRIYVITGTYTQGAAEWLVHCLRTSLGAERVSIVGEKTKGQGVMTQLVAANKGHHLYPAVARIRDAAGGTLISGIAPDTILREQSYYNLYNYGDTLEPLLNVTLKRMQR